MINKMFFLLSLVLFVACGPVPVMTNDEIIAEVEKCNAANMNAVVVRNGSRKEVVRVDCVPKNKFSAEMDFNLDILNLVRRNDE